VHHAVLDRFISALKDALFVFFGRDPASSADYARIVSDRHLERLGAMLDEAVQAGAEVLVGRDSEPEARHSGHALDAPSSRPAAPISRRVPSSGPAPSTRDRFLAPTIVKDVPESARLMQEEIFGPILPLIPIDGPEEALNRIRSLPPPLCAYIFADRSAGLADRFSAGARIGAVCENESLVHFVNPFAPFGGLAQSGIGRSHGKAGFLAFSNEQVIVRRRFGGWVIRKLHPPYSETTTRWINRLMRWS